MLVNHLFPSPSLPPPFVIMVMIYVVDSMVMTMNTGAPAAAALLVNRDAETLKIRYVKKSVESEFFDQDIESKNFPKNLKKIGQFFLIFLKT